MGNDRSLDVIERSATPRGEIQLQRRGSEYEIISNGTFLMATYNGESEKLLVQTALAASAVQQNCSMLLGGLGVGYSLAEALRDTRVQQVTVVEIEGKIIEWNRTHLARFSGNALDHRKTELVHADLIEWIAETQHTYDMICLDIDNGPDWTVYEQNNALYENEGLSTLYRLLNPGGIITFWSASASPKFLKRLAVHFPNVEEIAIAREPNVEPDFLYMAYV